MTTVIIDYFSLHEKKKVNGDWNSFSFLIMCST